MPKKSAVESQFKCDYISYRIDFDSEDYRILLDGKFVKMKKVIKFLIENAKLSSCIARITQVTEAKGVAVATTVNIDFNPCRSPSSDGDLYFFEWQGITCAIISSVFKEEYVWFRVYTLDADLADQTLSSLFTELLKLYEVPEQGPSFTVAIPRLNGSGYFWNSVCTKSYRSLDTVFLPDQVKSSMIKQFETFCKSQPLYEKFGVTWKMVTIFYGPPGTGKSSMIVTLASHFRYNICKMTISHNMTSEHVENLFQTIPPQTILVIEDVDSLFVERSSDKGVDFSTLLNCLDGLMTRPGLIVYMTTNHIDKLDSAFIRPGRVDHIVQFQPPNKDCIRQCLQTLVPQFKHEHDQYLSLVINPDTAVCKVSVTTIQRHLFGCIMDKKSTILEDVPQFDREQFKQALTVPEKSNSNDD